MNKIITLAIAFLLFIPFASINGNNVSLPNGDGILYVGGSGPNNYTSIQSAINDASNGCTIYVYYGNYNESIVINKSISLIGIEKNGEKPVIHAEENKSAVLILADGCILKAFVIISQEILISETNPPSCEIRSNYNIIENNTFMYGWCSFYLYESSYNILKNNEITKGYWEGLFTRECTHNIFLYNKAVDNMGEGFFFSRERNSKIIGNTATKNLHGMSFSLSSNCIISFNHVYFNQQYGICVDTSTNVSILNNTIHNHAYGGLQLMDCSNCTVSGNEIYYNDRGIMVESNYMWEKQYNLIKRNNVYSNSGVGIYIEGSLRNDFTENNLMDNGDNAWFWEQTIIGYPYSPLRPCYNVWDKNYWSDWSLPTPKPIKGVLTVWWSSLYIDFHWFMFDKHPAMEPYGNFTLENMVQPMNTLEKGGHVSTSSIRNFCVKS